MKKALVLGGGGFLGSHLADALLLEGQSVRIFERPGIPRYRNFTESEKIEWQEGDFNSQADIEVAVQGCSVVYHLISTTLPKSSNDNPIYDIESNVIGTVRLLEAARRAEVKKIVFISSGGTVYGIPKSVPITEEHSTDPTSSYGITKLAIEKYMSLYHELYGLDYSIIRLANPYGERQKSNAAQGVVAIFLHKAMTEQSIDIWGDGSVVRDYIYISDVIRVISKVTNYSGDVRIFNVGSGTGRSLNTILDTIENILKKPVKRTYKVGRLFDVPENVLDIQLAMKVLDWKPEVSFEEGVKKLYGSFKRL